MKKPKILLDVVEEVSLWYAKIEFINLQIASLEKVKNIPTLSASIFLLKSQYVEFLVRQLIIKIDLHAYFSSTHSEIRIKTRNPTDLNELTLGQLIKFISIRYEGKEISKLLSKLGKLHKLRNQFTHHLFDFGDVEDLKNDATKGLKIVKDAEEATYTFKDWLKTVDPIEK